MTDQQVAAQKPSSVNYVPRVKRKHVPITNEVDQEPCERFDEIHKPLV